MASCDFLARSKLAPHELRSLHLPDASQADERGPRARYGTFLVNFIEDYLTIDEVGVAREGYEERLIWWCFWSFVGRAIVSAS
jgi:hypothetical protein